MGTTYTLHACVHVLGHVHMRFLRYVQKNIFKKRIIGPDKVSKKQLPWFRTGHLTSKVLLMCTMKT